jgi:hypothetical protein
MSDERLAVSREDVIAAQQLSHPVMKFLASREETKSEEELRIALKEPLLELRLC